jgi:XPG N-terminal domain
MLRLSRSRNFQQRLSEGARSSSSGLMSGMQIQFTFGATGAYRSSVWLWQSQFATRHAHAQSGENPKLRTLFYKLARYMMDGVSLLFVFDGRGRPATKRATNVITRDHWLTEPLKDLIDAFGYHYYEVFREFQITCHGLLFSGSWRG